MPKPAYLLDRNIRLDQPENGFRTAIDAVLLAAACPVQKGEHVLDMGCGVGAVGLCVLWRCPDTTLTGIDIDPDFIDLAHQNAAHNQMHDRTIFLSGDICEYDVASPNQRFDHIVCNPPYLEAGRYIPSPVEKRAVALGHQQADITLKDWIDCGFRLLKPKGSLSFIHRADMCDAIIRGLGKRFGAIDILPIYPRDGQPAKRVIIRAFKDRLSPCTLHPGLVLHNETGSEYSLPAEKILRHAASCF